MAWLAFHRAVQLVEQCSYKANKEVERWRRLGIRFTGKFGARLQSAKAFTPVLWINADASLLLMPMIGFLPPDDPRVIGRSTLIERESWSVVRFSLCGRIHGRFGRGRVFAMLILVRQLSAYDWASAGLPVVRAPAQTAKRSGLCRRR